MAIYLDVVNLLVSKQAVAANYTGGLDEFRRDFNLPDSPINSEDDELFGLGQMNADAFDLAFLVRKGLHYDNATQSSKDFTIVGRYSDFEWPASWIEENKVFAWHIHTHKAVRDRALEIGDMHLEDIHNLMLKGVHLLKSFRLADL